MKSLLPRLLHKWLRLSWAWRAASIMAAALLLMLLIPSQQAAACSWNDGPCMGDQLMYNSMLIVGRVLWTINRILLLVAYLLDVIRFEIVQNLFLAPYEKLTQMVGAAIVPVAILAITVALLAILVTPISGTGAPFNIRQIFVILLIAPTVLLGLGTWLGDLDTFRVDIGQQLYAAAAQEDSAGGIGGVAPQTGDMATPQRLYPYMCGVGPGGGSAVLLPRRSGGAEGSYVMRPDELAAAYLYAGVQDIHCPYEAASSVSGFPAAWIDASVTPPFVLSGDIGAESDTVRAAAKDHLTEGLIRLFLGIFVCFLALVYYAAHLVFTLALVALWVGIPIGMLFGMFRKDFGWLGEFFKSAAEVLRNSWVTSFIIGLLMAGLIVASKTGNATVFAGLATGALVFLVFTFLNALGTLKTALQALASIAGSLAGGGAQMASAATGMVGRAAMGAMTGGASTALGAARGAGGAMAEMSRMGMIASAGARESGSMTYGMAAALGRNSAVMKAGELARTMGLLPGEGGESVLEAMRAGQSSVARGGKGAGGAGGSAGGVNFRAFNQRMQQSQRHGERLNAADAQRKSEREAKAAARQDEQRLGAISRLRDGNIAQRGVSAGIGVINVVPEVAARGAEVLGTGVEAVGKGAKAVGKGVKAVAQNPTAIVEGAVTAGRAALQTTENGVYTALDAGFTATTQAAKAARRVVDPRSRFEGAWRYGTNGQLEEVRGADAQVPDYARRDSFSPEDLDDMMRNGSTVRFHEDQTTSVWDAQGAMQHDVAVAEAEERYQTQQNRMEAAQDERAAADAAAQHNAELDVKWASGEEMEIPVNVVEQPELAPEQRLRTGVATPAPMPDPGPAEEVPVDVIKQPARSPVRTQAQGGGGRRAPTPDDTLTMMARLDPHQAEPSGDAPRGRGRQAEPSGETPRGRGRRTEGSEQPTRTPTGSGSNRSGGRPRPEPRIVLPPQQVKTVTDDSAIFDRPAAPPPPPPADDSAIFDK